MVLMSLGMDSRRFSAPQAAKNLILLVVSQEEDGPVTCDHRLNAARTEGL